MSTMAQPDDLEKFRDYLRTLPDELLASVTQDYIWLADLPLKKGALRTGLLLRRECCLEESAHRRTPRFCRASRTRPER